MAGLSDVVAGCKCLYSSQTMALSLKINAIPIVVSIMYQEVSLQRKYLASERRGETYCNIWLHVTLEDED